MKMSRAYHLLRGRRGQAMAEYAILLSITTGVVITLGYLLSNDYHKKVFDFWAGPLQKSVEIEVPRKPT